MIDVRLGRVAVAVLLGAVLAGSSGCGHSSPPPQPAAVTTPAAVKDARAARTNLLMVLDDYERDGAAVKTGTPKKDYGDDQSQYYADSAAMTRVHGSGGVGAPIGCGKAADKKVVDGAMIGSPTDAGGVTTLPVTLYIGTERVATAAVTADSTGKLTGVTCQAPTAPNLPGAEVLADFYGGVAALSGAADADSDADSDADGKVAALKDKYVAPAFAKFTRPDVDADQSLCAEDAMTYWHAAYDPTATATGAQWYFNSGGAGQVNMSVAVDSSSSHIAWVYCFGQLKPPLTPGLDYSDDQVQSFVGDLFNDYAYLQALKPFGADASGMKAYFASDAAYQAAVTGTGAQPLECSPTPATSIGADAVTVTGKTAVVTLSSSPSGHPVTSGVLGHPKVTVDLTTMRVTAVACG